MPIRIKRHVLFSNTSKFFLQNIELVLYGYANYDLAFNNLNQAN